MVNSPRVKSSCLWVESPHILVISHIISSVPALGQKGRNVRWPYDKNVTRIIGKMTSLLASWPFGELVCWRVTCCHLSHFFLTLTQSNMHLQMTTCNHFLTTSSAFIWCTRRGNSRKFASIIGVCELSHQRDDFCIISELACWPQTEQTDGWTDTKLLLYAYCHGCSQHNKHHRSMAMVDIH